MNDAPELTHYDLLNAGGGKDWEPGEAYDEV
jgi:hypothetical protein